MNLIFKKEGNYNIVVTWPCHVITLVIISNNIPLSPSIALIYNFFLPNYILNIPNFIYLLLEIVFFLLHC